MTAYDYDKQKWVTGPEGTRIRLEHLREELALLKSPRVDEYMVAVSCRMSKSEAITTCQRMIAECEAELNLQPATT